ncbi:MAG: hypothetical protein HUU38_00070 [Anaerolineales bacterium]|nr:hypothetical protein [Anaerolineales bacterium]
MQKPLIFIWFSLFISLVLISCGPSAAELAATATWQVYDNQVATIIMASKTAKAALPTITLTPTPAPITLEAALLTQNEVFSILSWEQEVNVDDFADADTFNFYHVWDFCDYNCIDRYWINGDWDSSLGILLSRYPTETTAEETYDKFFFPDSYTKPATEYPTLSTYILPEKTLVYEEQGYAILVGRQGRVIFLIGVRLPDTAPDQRIFYIGQFAEKQLLKLIEFGY